MSLWQSANKDRMVWFPPSEKKTWYMNERRGRVFCFFNKHYRTRVIDGEEFWFECSRCGKRLGYLYINAIPDRSNLTCT